MNNFYIFGNVMNGLEFVTYIIIPTAMVSVILTYLFFNLRLISISIEIDSKILKEIEDDCFGNKTLTIGIDNNDTITLNKEDKNKQKKEDRM